MEATILIRARGVGFRGYVGICREMLHPKMENPMGKSLDKFLGCAM